MINQRLIDNNTNNDNSVYKRQYETTSTNECKTWIYRVNYTSAGINNLLLTGVEWMTS